MADKAKSDQAIKRSSDQESKKDNAVKAKSLATQDKKKKEIDYSVDLGKMLEAGVHFGHLAKRWHPKMSKYIWKRKGDVHIFDLLRTNESLQKACEAITQLAGQGKSILFVGTKRQASAIVKEEAKRAGVFYVAARWPGGLVTNWPQIKKSIRRYGDLKDGLVKGKYDRYTKKERVLLDREMSRLERLFGGVADMKAIPDILFVIDPGREKSAVREARLTNITVFAITDSNCDPDLIDYIVPGNDDAVRSIKLLVEKFTDAVIEGKEKLKKLQVTSNEENTKLKVKSGK